MPDTHIIIHPGADSEFTDGLCDYCDDDDIDGKQPAVATLQEPSSGGGATQFSLCAGHLERLSIELDEVLDDIAPVENDAEPTPQETLETLMDTQKYMHAEAAQAGWDFDGITSLQGSWQLLYNKQLSPTPDDRIMLSLSLNPFIVGFYTFNRDVTEPEVKDALDLFGLTDQQLNVQFRLTAKTPQGDGYLHSVTYGLDHGYESSDLTVAL